MLIQRRCAEPALAYDVALPLAWCRDLYDNGFSGELPPEWGNADRFPALQYLLSRPTLLMPRAIPMLVLGMHFPP